MDLYWFTLCLGFGGLAFVAILGHGHFHSPLKHGGRAAHAKSHQGADHGQHPATWLSPQTWLSALLGFGATGILIEHLLGTGSAFLLIPLALAGGWFFERVIVRPFWSFLMGFASRPARTLETAVRGEGRAASNFDASGNGLVALDVDGQVVQLLGCLRGEERSAGWKVRSGDRVFVREVDPRRTHCTVSLVAP